MMAGAFTGGNGDYVTLFEPTATEVEQAGKGYILCSIGQESGEIPYTAYFANRSYVEANPETVQGFVNAMALAQQWVAEHTDRQVAEAICDQFPDTDLDVLEREPHPGDGAAGPGAAGDGHDPGRGADPGPVGGLRRAGG